MPADLTRADVDRIAALAHLELSEAEKVLFTRQLADILAYAMQIQALDTAQVSPTSHAGSASAVLRPDEPRPSLLREEALAGAPEPAHAEGQFKVPRVFGS